jgi:hypothetical protein
VLDWLEEALPEGLAELAPLEGLAELELPDGLLDMAPELDDLEDDDDVAAISILLTLLLLSTVTVMRWPADKSLSVLPVWLN